MVLRNDGGPSLTRTGDLPIMRPAESVRKPKKSNEKDFWNVCFRSITDQFRSMSEESVH